MQMVLIAMCIPATTRGTRCPPRAPTHIPPKACWHFEMWGVRYISYPRHYQQTKLFPISRRSTIRSSSDRLSDGADWGAGGVEHRYHEDRSVPPRHPPQTLLSKPKTLLGSKEAEKRSYGVPSLDFHPWWVEAEPAQMPWSPQVRPWDTELFEWGAQPLQQGCERVWRSCGLGLVFLGCFPNAMAMRQGCPSLCPFLPVVAASCQPNKKDTPHPLPEGSALRLCSS